MSKLNFVDKYKIEEVKRISIVGFLHSIGFDPVKQSGNEMYYLSPLRPDSNPSFFVNTTKNRFIDFGDSTKFKGDVIKLFQLIHSCSFLEAVERLLNVDWSEIVPFSFSGKESQEQLNTEIKIIAVKSLQNSALIQYVRFRGISFDLARIYLKEVNYQCKGKSYFALGFENDLGGFELRSKYFQGSTSPKWFSTIRGKPNGQLNVFEGFFDFLSCCQHHQVTSLGSTSLILNSVSLIGKALPSISEFSRVRTFLDNDDPGKKAVLKLEQHGICVKDHSDTYMPHKDYNGFWSAFQSEFSSGFQSGQP